MSDQENRYTVLESARLYEIGHTLVSTLNLDETLDQVLQSLEEIVGPHEFIILLVNEPQDELYARSQRGYPAEATRALRIKIGQEGITGWVAQTGQPLYVPDVTQDSRHIPVTTNYGSEMAAPLRVRGKVIGVLDVASHWPHAFSSDDLRALSAFAGYAAAAIENARLFEAERAARERAETLQAATQALSATLDLQQVFSLILSELQQVVPYDSASVQQLRGERLEIIGGHGFPNLEELLGKSFDPGAGDNPNREVVRTRAPFIVDDAPAVYPQFRSEPYVQMVIRSWLGVPLLFGDRLIGMVTLDKREAHFYTQEHARLAMAFAAQAAIAIENARLYAEVRGTKDSLEGRVAERTRELAQSEAALRQRNQELAALNAIASITSRALDLDEVLDWVLEQAIQVFEPAREGAIFVLADAGRELRLRAHRGLPPETVQQMMSISPDEGPYQEAVETGQPVYAASAKEDMLCGCPLEINGKGCILVPLKTEGSVHGVLSLYLPATYQPNQADQGLLMAIGYQIGLAIERGELFSRITTMNRTLEQQVVERTMELYREKERLDTILRHVPDGIMFTDAQATILYVNPGFEKITGYTAREALGRNAKFLGSDQTPLKIYQDLRQALTDGAMWQGELVNRHRDGRLYDAHLIISPIQDRQGNLLNMVGSLRDITRLKELDRMKSQFVSTVSHELRTPVAAIKLHTENMLEFFDRMSPDQRHSFLADIQTQAETLAQLIEDILNLSRLEVGPPQPQLQSIEFVALLQEILDQIAPLAENAGVSLHILDVAPHLSLKADWGQLKNVLRNLVSNAIKFTPAGGQVTCRAQAEDGYLILSVSDTGMGIPPEDLPHIFERFYRGTQVASQHIPGTGLGLAIVKQIVEAHAGTVTVESAPGEGTTFTVRLPHAETGQLPVLSHLSFAPKDIEQELNR